MFRIALIILCLPLFSVKAALTTDWTIGTDDSSTAEFEIESQAGDHYYLENGDYTSVGGVVWDQGREPTIVTTNVGDYDGFERAISFWDDTTHIYFQLGQGQTGPDAQLQFTIGLIQLGPGSMHDLEFRLNDTLIHSVTNITASQIETITGLASTFTAQPGPNKLTITRTGGGDTPSPWIQFDTLRLETDPPPLLQAFTTDRNPINPGETATLSWVCNSNVTSVVINPLPGDVTGLTTNGTGSATLFPLASTTYTLTASDGVDTETEELFITYNKFTQRWIAGTNNNTTTEMSHEGRADDDYYFAGDYSSVGGPVQVADELLLDDSTPNGNDGDPAIGYERALTIGDPQSNIWFILPTNAALPQVSYRFTLDVQGMPAGASHDLEFTFNGQAAHLVPGVNGPQLITIDWSGSEVQPVAGPNVISYRLLPEKSIGAYLIFDYAALETQVTPATVSQVTADGILGTRTVFWTGQPGEQYLIQKSADAMNWTTLDHGFPRGGATVSEQFFEDRITPFTDPQPAYRIFQE